MRADASWHSGPILKGQPYRHCFVSAKTVYKFEFVIEVEHIGKDMTKEKKEGPYRQPRNAAGKSKTFHRMATGLKGNLHGRTKENPYHNAVLTAL